MFEGETQDRIKHLCDLIAKEQDHHRFSLLIAELNQLLEASDSKGSVDPLRGGGPPHDRKP